jgi:hypothetical protein
MNLGSSTKPSILASAESLKRSGRAIIVLPPPQPNVCAKAVRAIPGRGSAIQSVAMLRARTANR